MEGQCERVLQGQWSKKAAVLSPTCTCIDWNGLPVRDLDQ